MKKDTNKKKPVKKANPLLEDEEKDETDTVDTSADEENEAETDTEETDEETEEEVDAKPKKKPAKVASKAVEEDEDADEDADSSVVRGKAPVRTRNSVEAEMHSDIENTRRALAKEPKVRIFVPLGIGEKKGSPSAVETVTINGFRQVLPKGEYITVAQSIADQIEAHYNMAPENTEAGMASRLDRPRFKDGMSTDDALMNG